MEEQEGGFCWPAIKVDGKPLHAQIIEAKTGKPYESGRGGCLPEWDWYAGKVKMTIEFLEVRMEEHES